MPHVRSTQAKKQRGRRRKLAGKLEDHPWVTSTQELSAAAVEGKPRDGSGYSGQWDKFEFRESELPLIESISGILIKHTEKFCAARKDFLDRFFASSRDEQSAMSAEWNADDGASLNSVANDLLEELTTFISVAKGIDKSELDKLAAPPSPLRARLLEELCLITAPGKEATTESPGEDAEICRMVAEGTPIGILIPVRENAEWPAVDTDKFGKPKKDEPAFVRWPSEKLEELRLRDWPQGSIPPDMYGLFEELIAKELRLGRLSEIDPMSPDCKALSKVHVMWKNGKEFKAIRQLDDFRRSGINITVRTGALLESKCEDSSARGLRTTCCLPRFRDVYDLLANVPRPNPSIGDEDSQVWLLEWDIVSAFRLISVESSERGFLCFLDPRDPSRAFKHNCLPFGLVTSPSVFGRLSAASLRCVKRLLDYALRMVAPEIGTTIFRAIVYVDDYTMATSKARFCLVFSLLLMTALGIPIELTKTHALRSDGRILGYRVDIGENNEIELSVPMSKRNKITAVLSSDQLCIPRAKLETLVGRINWCTGWIPEIRPKLDMLYEVLMVLRRRPSLRSAKISPTRRLELHKFAETFSHGHHKCIPYIDYKDEYLLVTDASFRGLGGYFFPRCDTRNVRWFSINMEEDPEIWRQIWYQRRNRLDDQLPDELEPVKFVSGDSNFLELLAVYYGCECIRAICAPRETYIRCFSDNTCTVSVLRSFRSRSTSLASVVRKFGDLRYRLNAHHIAGTLNNIADDISRITRASLVSTGQMPRSWREVPRQVLQKVVTFTPP